MGNLQITTLPKTVDIKASTITPPLVAVPQVSPSQINIPLGGVVSQEHLGLGLSTNLPVTELQELKQDIVSQKFLPPTDEEIKEMFKNFDTIEEDELDEYIAKFKKLSPEFQRELVENAEKIFPNNLLFEKDAEMLIKNYKTIMSSIDFDKFKGSELWDEGFYEYIEDVEILSKNTELVINLINSKNKLALEMLKNDYTEDQIKSYIEKGALTPEVSSVFEKSHLDINEIKEFLTMDKSLRNRFLSIINPKNLDSFFNDYKAKKLILAIFNPFHEAGNNNSIESFLGKIAQGHKGDMSTLQKIAAKLSFLSFGTKNIPYLDKIAEFYQKIYGEQISEILSDPNLDLISLDPTEYGLPEVTFCKGNMIILQQPNSDLLSRSYRTGKNETVFNLSSGEKLYEINGNLVKLNDGKTIIDDSDSYLLQDENGNTLNKIKFVGDGFPIVDEKDKTLNYSRLVLSDGTEEQIYNIHSKDGTEFFIQYSRKDDLIDISVILTDKNGNQIIKQEIGIEPDSEGEGNETTVEINNQRNIYSSMIDKDNFVRVSHDYDGKKIHVTSVELWDLIDTAEFDPAYRSELRRVIKDGDDIHDDKINESIKLFKDFLKNIKADDLLGIIKNKQKIDFKQFDSDFEKHKDYIFTDIDMDDDSKYCFYEDRNSFKLDIGNHSSCTNTHEYGHGIDKKLKISRDSAIKEIYNQELQNISEEAKYFLDYFLPASTSPVGGLGELVAETNALMNATELLRSYDRKITIRDIYLMKEFPQTIAAIMKKLAEYKAGL